MTRPKSKDLNPEYKTGEALNLDMICHKLLKKNEPFYTIIEGKRYKLELKEAEE